MIFLFYSIVSLFNCMVEMFPCPTCTSLARYSLFVLKVPLTTINQTKLLKIHHSSNVLIHCLMKY